MSGAGGATQSEVVHEVMEDSLGGYGAWSSKVQAQSGRAGAGDTHADELVGLLLLGSEDTVSMVWYAVEDSGHAGAANALAASDVAGNAPLVEHVGDRTIGRNLQLGAAARKDDSEGGRGFRRG